MGSAALFVLYRAEKFSYFYKLLISLNKDSDKLQKGFNRLLYHFILYLVGIIWK